MMSLEESSTALMKRLKCLVFPTAFEFSLTVVRTVFASRVSNALPTSAHLGADLFFIAE
jgi:hypothetical protein